MTPDEILALVAEATPGEWSVTDSDLKDDHIPEFHNPDNYLGMLSGGLRHHGIKADKEAKGDQIIGSVWNHHHSRMCDANANLIVAMKNNIVALCEIAKTAQKYRTVHTDGKLSFRQMKEAGDNLDEALNKLNEDK